MTEPTDPSRLVSPAPPHDKPHDRQLPGSPPPAPPLPPATDTQTDTTSRPSGPTNPMAANLGLFLAFLFFIFIFSAPIFFCLYPLTATITTLGGLETYHLLQIFVPSLAPDSRLPIAMFVGVVTFWLMCRYEHRLAAKNKTYRDARHYVRLVLIGAFFSLTLLNDRGGRWLPTSAGEAVAVFGNIPHLVAWIVGAVGAHFFLSKAKSIWTYWDTALRVLRLRPA